MVFWDPFQFSDLLSPGPAKPPCPPLALKRPRSNSGGFCSRGHSQSPPIGRPRREPTPTLADWGSPKGPFPCSEPACPRLETAFSVLSVAAALLATLIIGALFYGRDVFVPIALAVLLSFVLAPVVRRLENWRIPRGVSSIGVVALAFLGIFAVGGVIATQVAELASELPRYEAQRDPTCFRIWARN